MQRALNLAGDLIRPDEVIHRTFLTFPRGIEQRNVRSFRLGDYFDNVELSEIDDDQSSFLIVFHVSQGVESYWKDLVSAILRTISDTLPGASATPFVRQA